MDSLKLLSQNMLEFSRGLGDILAQDGAPRVSHQVRKAEGGEALLVVRQAPTKDHGGVPRRRTV